MMLLQQLRHRMCPRGKAGVDENSGLKNGVGSRNPDTVLTARNGMRIVVRAVLFCADVAERPGAKGDHKERPFVNVVAVGSGGMTLEISRITRDRIYNRLGECGRKDPRTNCLKRTGSNKRTACGRQIFYTLCQPFALLRTRGCRADWNVDSPPSGFVVFWMPPPASVRVASPLFARCSKANVRRNHKDFSCKVCVQLGEEQHFNLLSGLNSRGSGLQDDSDGWARAWGTLGETQRKLPRRAYRHKCREI